MGKYTDLNGSHRGAIKRIKELEAEEVEDLIHPGSEHTPLDIEGGLKDMPLIDFMSSDERQDFQYRVDIGDTVGAFEILLKFFATIDSPLGNLLREMEDD